MNFSHEYQQVIQVNSFDCLGGFSDKTDSANCTAFQDLLPLRVRPLVVVVVTTNQSQLS